MEERTDEEGNQVLFQLNGADTSNETEARQAVTDYVTKTLDETVGIELVHNTQEEGQKVAGGDTELMAVSDKFDEELQQQIDGTLPKGHIYDMGKPSGELKSCGIPDLPIQLNAARLAEKSSQYGHNFDLSEVKGLVYAISHPIAVFSYGKGDDARNIIVNIQKDGKNFLVGMFMRPTVNGQHLEINSIRNVFPKDTHEWVNWIQQGKLLGGNKEEIQTLIDKQRINLADVDYIDLDSVAKILNSDGYSNFSDVKNSNNAELMRVFHGSAAVFDHFDSSHFTEGEGSMVYGAGHYVSNVESTGKMYANVASRETGNKPQLYRVEVPDDRIL